jgi:alkylation response protein AidB-like acyl-CoA dehydrogenase
MVVPVELGGAGISPWAIAPVIEAMARIDGSAGWTLALGQGLLAARMSPGGAGAVFSAERVLVAGSLNPTQARVRRSDGGYEFEGTGTYVSNGTHATHMMLAGVLVEENGRPAVSAAGPVILAGVLPRSDCEILDTWAMTGMRGTGSHDVRFHGFVPEELTMPLGDALANLGGQLTPVSLGIAQHAVDAFIELAATKVPLGARSPLRDRVTAQDQLGRAAGLLQAGRSCFYEGMREAFEADRDAVPLSIEHRVRQRLASMMGAQLAADAVNIIFDAAGMTGAALSSDIERCWRDVNVVRQHITLASTRYEVVGRVMLGLEPGSPLI